jgi:uncharacterized protein YjdB
MAYTRIAGRALLATLLTIGSLSCGGKLTDATPAGLAYINLALKSASLHVGQHTTAAVSFKNASGASLTARSVSWTSTAPSVAAVSTAGDITALSPGNAMIVATADGKSASAQLAVLASSSDAVPVASISIVFDLSGIRAGDTAQAVAIARDADGNILADRPLVWTSSDTTIARVSSSGVITAVGYGTVTITASSDGTSSSVTFTILPPLPKPVASVIVSIGVATLLPGQSTPAYAILRDADGNVLEDRVVTWASSNTNVAIVTPSGVVYAIAPGTTQIVASSEGFSDDVTVSVQSTTPTPPPPSGTPTEPVATVSASIASTTVMVGQSLQASAVTRDATGKVLNGRSITWASSNNGIASVSPTGVVTGVSAGSATITATSESKNGALNIAVTAAPLVPVATVSVSLGASGGNPGQTTQATATTRDAGGAVLSGRTIAWATSNASVAIVSPTGVVTAIAAGTANIIATSEGKSGSATYNVTVPPPAPVATVTVSLATSTLNIGQTTQASAVTRDASGFVLSGRAVSWSSSNPSIATVSSTGVVTAVAAGSASITATSETKTGSATASVNAPAPAPVSTVTVSLATSTIQPGQTSQASAVTRDANGNVLTGRTITWTSSNNAVATVSSNGLVTGVAAGSATITATSETKTGSAGITVQAVAPVPVATVSVSLASSTIQSGQTSQATAVARDASNNVLTGRVVTWSSSNTAVATVSSSGLVTGVAAGSATITATSETKTGSASITVQTPAPVPVATVSVTLASSSVQAGETSQATAVTRDASNNVLTGRVVTWTSSNTAVATVSSSGLVTAVAAGTATITATSETKIGSASLTVSVPAPPPPGGSVEPAGFTKVLERGWDVLGEGGWYDQLEDGAALANKYKIVQDATAPKSPSNVGMQIFPKGFSLSGVSPAVAEKGLGNKGTVYVAFWVKVSSNWVGHPSGVLKTLHFWTGGSNKLIPEITGQGSGTLQPTIAIQNTVTSGSHLYMPNLVPNAQFTRGAWHRMEYIMTGNTSGANGRVEWWMDGVKVGDVSGLQFNSGAATWELIQVNPTYGGSESGSLQVEQYIYFDHLYVSGK